MAAVAKRKAHVLKEPSSALRVRLTPEYINRLPALPEPYRVRDIAVTGLFVRVQPTGIKSFNIQWSRSSSKSLGKFPGMRLDTARKRALAVLNDAAEHGVPEVAKRRSKDSTLRKFLDDDLLPWATAHRKWGAGSVKRIKAAFADRLDKPLSELTAWVIEKWRSQRLKAGIADGTVNRELAGLKSALAKAVEWGAIAANPLSPVKLRKVDNARVRYLSPAEEKRLRTALAKRDRDGIAGRARGNAHRAERGYELLQAIPAGGYFDHLTPMVLLALNTGLRRGELVALDWGDINLRAKDLLVRAAAAKSATSRHVPLNKEAVAILTRWQRQTGGEGRLFNVRDVKTAWLALMKAAAVEGFNFHDLRHSFASKLVMAGVDLNTVRELLGHADLKMTLRYAHLAQEHKQSAVDKLVHSARSVRRLP